MKTINTINVSFDNAEWKALQEVKGKQSWRKFILERAAIDSSNELHTKGINADALRGLCLEYDLEHGRYADPSYVGFSFLHFFLETVVKVKTLRGTKDHFAWEKQIVRLKEEKEAKELK